MKMTIIFKQLFLRNCLANQSQTLCGPSLGREMKVYVNGQGHMTKMAAMAINSIFFKSSSSEPESL